MQGDLSAVLSEVDAVVSREDAAPKDVADAAMALAYLQARGDRRYVGACSSCCGWFSWDSLAHLANCWNRGVAYPVCL